MKAGLRLLTSLLLLAAGSNAQNVFNYNDVVYTYNASAPAGSNTNPNTPPGNTMAKWIRTVRMSWDAGKFKCYYYNGMAFRLRFPNNYDPSGATKYPLMVFYHGGGETGPVTDNEFQLLWGAQLFEQRINAGEWNGFLLFPQEITVGWDDSYFSRVNVILDTLQRYNNLDPDRTITMGLSSGGYGAMAHAQLYPKRVATIIAASPSYVNSLNYNLGGIVHIPLWISNGGTDANPDPYQVNAFVSSFLGAGGNCYQTYLADEGHNTWVYQWALNDITSHDLLSGWWNKAHKAQPLVYYNNDKFCSGKVNARLGITPGYLAYEWQRDNGGGFTSIAGAGANEYQATQPGRYRVRFQRDAGSGWSAWSPNPVNLAEKTCTTDTLFAERFEAGYPFYYAATAYKPATFDCQNGVFTSSTYNITLDGSGKTGGRFLLHNTNSGGSCVYTGNDIVWRATATVTVTPNTNYEYCFYLANRSTTGNAKIVPAINGVPVAGSYVQSPGSGDGSWTKFSFLWNSGSATAADLALINQGTATSGNDFAIDDISFGRPASGQPANQPPIARAGADATITLPASSVTLNGSASTDPDGSIVTYAWTKISGPTQYTIASPGSAITQVSNLTTGAYAFRLLVTDNKSATAADTVLVTVNAVVPNQPPIARAGTDVVLNYPKNKTNLNGSASTDPDGSIVSYAWTKISGPFLYTIASPNSANTQVSNLLTGVYAFRLRVTDNKGATAADTVVVTVKSRTATNLQETARAGADTGISVSNTSIVTGGPSLSNQAARFNPLVYPNPTNGGFVLDFSLEKKQTVWITLTSGADGRICYTETLNTFSGHYHKNLDQVRLAKGNYAVTIRTETGTKTIVLVKY